MSHGIKRRPYQTCPNGLKITCVEINDHGYAEFGWFRDSIELWPHHNDLVASYRKKIAIGDCFVHKDWDYVLVVPLSSVKQFWCGNDGMQAWRHRRTGYVVPDRCRQEGGCPEMWNTSEVKGKRELEIKNLVEVTAYVVTDFAQQVVRSAFSEVRFPKATPTS